MNKILLLLITQFALLLAFESQAVETQYLLSLKDARYHHVESKEVGRGYHVYVMVPDGYDVSEDVVYPTIYVLDGGGLFPLMTAYYRYLNFGEEAPDAIIVGISYGGDTVETGNYRSTDYTAPSSERESWGGAEAFSRFLSTELFPVIENGYASDADKRVVFGQSIGGQFALYSALKQPNLFWGHIASNPALHRNLDYFLQSANMPATGRNKPRVWVGSGTQDDPTYRVPAQAWIAHWSAIEQKPWALRVVNLEGHTHMSAPPASFRQGLRWIFELD